jgi:hypothetical protein
VNLSRAINRSDPAGCSALMHACSPLPQKEDDEEEEDDEGIYSDLSSLLDCSLFIVIVDDLADISGCVLLRYSN